MKFCCTNTKLTSELFIDSPTTKSVSSFTSLATFSLSILFFFRYRKIMKKVPTGKKSYTIYLFHYTICGSPSVIAVIELANDKCVYWNEINLRLLRNQLILGMAWQEIVSSFHALLHCICERVREMRRVISGQVISNSYRRLRR